MLCLLSSLYFKGGLWAGTIALLAVVLNFASDFQYENAQPWFLNLDKLIKATNADGRVHAFYSSPAQYVAAKLEEAKLNQVVWTVVSGDNAGQLIFIDINALVRAIYQFLCLR